MIAADFGPTAAPLEVMKNVHHHNGDTLWVVSRDRSRTAEADEVAGCYAFLFLAEEGHKALLARTLDTINPPLSMLASAGERPAAIYFWAVVAGGVGSIATRLIAIGLGAPLYADLPAYARPGIVGGLKWDPRATPCTRISASARSGRSSDFTP
jgi:hypothetical protein